jgi:site-specific DNA-methyltransferase (adenine-specific)
MSEFNVLCGDAAAMLRSLPDKSIHTCVTSPPYFNLRDYGIEGQIGTGSDVKEFIESLTRVFEEVQRVLRDDGTLWVNMGDSYATRSGSQPPTNTRNSCGHTKKSVPEGFKYKDLIGIPWRLAFALQEQGWYLRQDIVWQKPNCIPESVHDRFTRSHEYIFLLSKRQKYYFDQESIKEPVTGRTALFYLQKQEAGEQNVHMSVAPTRNKRDVWSVNTAPHAGAHFAVFPEELILPCVLAGCPEGGTVLDPFCGSGTTGVVALKHDRNFIGIDLNPDYCEMSRKRILESVNE